MPRVAPVPPRRRASEVNERSAPLRVLRVIARLNVGGPSRHVALLDRGLRQRGYETLLVHGEVAPGEASLDDLVHAFGNPHVRLAHLGRRISATSDAYAFVSLVRLVFRFHPDVLHTHTAKAGALGRLAACVYNATRSRSSRCLVVHTFHGNVFSGYFSRAGSVAARAVERALAVVTDRVVAIAEQQRREIVDTYRIASAGKVTVVPLGLDLGALLSLAPGAPSLRDELGLTRDDIVFGFVGRLVPIKDVPSLIEAFSHVARRVAAARLVLAGDGELRAALEQQVEERDLRSRVIFAGWRSDLVRLYATFDALVLSSRNEGTPVAVIEAMAAGLPVVSTAAGGVAELVDHRVTGWVVPVGDSAALSAAMIEAAEAPALRARMGAAARHAASSRYGYQRLVADIETLYRTHLPKRRSTS